MCICPKEMESILTSLLHFHVSYNIIYNDSDVDQVFIENKHINAHILFGFKNNWNMITCKNSDEHEEDMLRQTEKHKYFMNLNSSK